MTFREKSITRLYAFAMAAVFALVLAGCGGGGGSATAPTTPDPDPTPMPSPQEMCEADGGRYNADGSCTSAADLAEEMALSGAQEAAMAAYMMAMGYVGGAKDPVAMGKAKMYADMAKEASDAAAMATTSAMAMEYQMKAEMNRDMAMEAAGMRGLGLTDLANTVVNKQQITNAELEGKTGNDVPKPRSNAARVGPAIGTAAGGVVTRTGAAGAAGNTWQGSSAASATAEYRASGPSFTVTPASLRGEVPQRLTTRGGWMGAEMVQGVTTATTKVYVNLYTDIQAPVVRDRYATSTTDSANYLDETGLTGDLANDPVITDAEVPTNGSTFTATYNRNPTDNEPAVMGRFYCPPGTTTCTISVQADGEVTAIAGYQFQPRLSGTTSTDDGDYLTWGVWLSVPNATNGEFGGTAADNFGVTLGAFASGSETFNVLAVLTGKATYNGVATGLYAAGGMVEYFDADVSLEANFGGNVGADNPDEAGVDTNLLGVVTGTVSNIKAGGMDVAGSLDLKRATIADSTGASVAGFAGDTSGTLAGRAMSGEWGGQFYGPNDATATSKAAETEYPTTAAGTFGASAPGNANDPIRILGSFGTWKAE